MSNEEIIDEILHEAEELKLREYVIDMSKVLLDRNERMDRVEAMRLALNNAKLHSGIRTKKYE